MDTSNIAKVIIDFYKKILDSKYLFLDWSEYAGLS